MRNSVRHVDFACLLSPRHKSLSTKLLAVSSCQTVHGRRQFWMAASTLPGALASLQGLRRVGVSPGAGPHADGTRRGGPALPAPQAG